MAQTVPAPAANPPTNDSSSKPLQGVTVQGKRPDVQREIDRKSYSLANDQQAATGSVADVLRNLPGVDVDPRARSAFAATRTSPSWSTASPRRYSRVRGARICCSSGEPQLVESNSIICEVDGIH